MNSDKEDEMKDMIDDFIESFCDEYKLHLAWDFREELEKCALALQAKGYSLGEKDDDEINAEIWDELVGRIRHTVDFSGLE